jgi:hypothetical protein
VIDLLDALLHVLEPGGDMVTSDGYARRQADSGTWVDHNAEEPTRFEPGALYGWVTGDDHLPDVAGPSVRENFSLAVVFTVDAQDEVAMGHRRRDVSLALDARTHSYLSVLADNRSRYAADGQPTPWAHIQGSVDHNYTRNNDLRGAALVVIGYRRSPGG